MGQTICMRQPTKKTSIGRPVNEVNCWRVAAIGPLFRHRASPSPPTEITMSAFLAALKAGPLLADGAMGSYIFERTGRLSELNHVYEALSVDEHRIEIVCAPGKPGRRPPAVFVDGEPDTVDVSLSHDGHWIAWAFAAATARSADS